MSDKLIPKEITLETTCKPYGDGMSSGSTIGMTLNLADLNMGWPELRVEIFRTKEQLDLMVLTMELAKGTLNVSSFNARKANIKQFYDKILKRVEDGQSSGTTEAN